MIIWSSTEVSLSAGHNKAAYFIGACGFEQQRGILGSIGSYMQFRLWIGSVADAYFAGSITCRWFTYKKSRKSAFKANCKTMHFVAGEKSSYRSCSNNNLIGRSWFKPVSYQHNSACACFRSTAKNITLLATCKDGIKTTNDIRVGAAAIYYWLCTCNKTKTWWNNIIIANGSRFCTRYSIVWP